MMNATIFKWVYDNKLWNTYEATDVSFPVGKRQFFFNIRVFLCPISEACMGVLGIQDICHFTSRDIGYFPFYFQGYGILCLILFGLLSRILNILEN